jgi:hypothetical protein
LERDLGEVGDPGGAEEFANGERGADGENIHSGGAGGLDAGGGVFDDGAVARTEVELRGGFEVAVGIGLAGADVFIADEAVGDGQACEAEAGFGEGARGRCDDGPFVRLQRGDKFYGAGQRYDAVAVGDGGAVERGGFGFGVEVRCDLANGVAGEAAVGDGEDGGESDAVAFAPGAPHEFNTGGGVDEGAVHVEEDGAGPDFEHAKDL